jgi:hypothetical protein
MVSSLAIHEGAPGGYRSILRDRARDWSQKRGSTKEMRYLIVVRPTRTWGDFVTNHSDRRVNSPVVRSRQK